MRNHQLPQDLNFNQGKLKLQDCMFRPHHPWSSGPQGYNSLKLNLKFLTSATPQTCQNSLRTSGFGTWLTSQRWLQKTHRSVPRDQPQDRDPRTRVMNVGPQSQKSTAVSVPSEDARRESGFFKTMHFFPEKCPQLSLACPVTLHFIYLFGGFLLNDSRTDWK